MLQAFDEGWAGVAFKTIGAFVPQEVSPRFATLKKESDPFVGFKNIEQISDHTLEENLGFIRRLKAEYPTKVIIASIMGRDESEWETLARKVQEAGADIIECNFSCPHMAAHGLGSDVGQSPELVALYVKAAKRFVSQPQVGNSASVGGYSGKAVKPIALRFVCDVKKCFGEKDVPVSGMGGIESWRDAAEFMALGCGTVQVTTAVMQYGY